jgi:hypothetical protein
VLNQIELQTSRFDAEYARNPNVAARATNDNLLDIIDIVQGDAALNVAAGGNGTPGTVGGFGEFPGYTTGTITHFQDNQAQTNFWAQFLAEGNVINNQLDNVAAGNNSTPGEVQALITEIQNYEKFGASFDQSQGGVFGARFDNELLGGTLKADTANAVQGLQGIANGDTGATLAADQAQIQAAGQGFIADAADVSGNNTPIGGGTYVDTATTVSGATSVAGIAQGSIPVAGTASGSTGLSGAQNGNGSGQHGGTGTSAGNPCGSGHENSAGNDGQGNNHGGANQTSGNQNFGGQNFGNIAENAFGHDHFHDHGANHFELMWHHG